MVTPGNEMFAYDSADDAPPPPPSGIVPPDLDDFDKEGMLHDSMNMAQENSHDRVAFSTLMAGLFKPQLDTELEPFKISNLLKPKQRRALDLALELFYWEYTSIACNRHGALALLSSQASAVRNNAKAEAMPEFDRAMELADGVTRLSNQIAYLSNLPKSRRMIGVPSLEKQRQMWYEYQTEIQGLQQEVARLREEARSYYYYHKAWLEMQHSLAETAARGWRVVDYTDVRRKWQSKQFEAGELISSMPWSYQAAYKMHISSLSEGATWRQFIVSVFTQSPLTPTKMPRSRNGRGGLPARRGRNAGPGDPDF